MLAKGDPLPGWLVLGEQPGVELAFGAVGKFWQGKIEWRDVALEDFARFDEAGFGKIACDLRVRPCGAEHTLLTYECRTATTSAGAQRRFAAVLVVDQAVRRLHHAGDASHHPA